MHDYVRLNTSSEAPDVPDSCGQDLDFNSEGYELISEIEPAQGLCGNYRRILIGNQ